MDTVGMIALTDGNGALRPRVHREWGQV